MKNFGYARAENIGGAIQSITANHRAKFLSGGTNLVDLMRENIEIPDQLIDITALPLAEISELSDGGLTIGALVKNSHLATNQLIRERYPFLSEAILNGASAQIRNMATTGGNLLQRTRCHYFYEQTTRCNKREPGTGCDALEGFNRYHAILGASEACIATHPSDMCVALAALDARVHVQGEDGARIIPFNEFHRLPADRPEIDTNLKSDELIVSVELPALDCARNSRYRKVRDRASYAFALVSIAAAMEVVDGTIKEVRLAFGGVAHKPWRATIAEQLLMGKTAAEETFQTAIAAELKDARGYKYNSFKIELLQRAAVSLLKSLAATEVKR